MRWTFLCALVFMTAQALATVFGSDDRRELITDPGYKNLARGLAMWTSPVYFQIDANGLQLDFPILNSVESEGVCKNERFASQHNNPVACTGFLIAPDLLVTAGHCMVNQGIKQNEVPPSCTDFDWLFDYTADLSGKVSLRNQSSDRMVKCKRVVYGTHNPHYDPNKKTLTYGDDFALVQLSRPLNDRPIFKLAKQSVSLGQPLTVLAHPNGLPIKIHQGRVLSLAQNGFFRTNLDSLGGESGAPVLNLNKEVVGILVRGFPDADYVEDEAAGCRRVNICRQDGTQCAQGDEYQPGTEVQTLDALNGILQSLR